MTFTLAPIDIVVVIAIFQLAIFIFFLLLRKNRNLPNALLALFLFSQFAILINALGYRHYSFFHARWPHLFHLGLAFYLIASPALYFYVRSRAYADFTITKKQLLHLLPFAVLVLYLSFTFYFHSAATKRILMDRQEPVSQTFARVYVLAFYCQILIYNIAALKVLTRYRARLQEQFSSFAHFNMSWLTFVLYGFIFSWLSSVFETIVSIAAPSVYPSVNWIGMNGFG